MRTANISVKIELRMAQYLAKLRRKDRSLACTYVQGFIKGFETMRIDISPKKSVNIRYAIGQERMVKAAIQMFEKEVWHQYCSGIRSAV